MEYTSVTKLQSGENSNSVTRKILLFIVTLALLITFSIWQNGIPKNQVVRQASSKERVDKTGNNEMSAVKFTTLPFILAFKHFIVEREE